jgi:hypothetical protein
MPTITYSSLSKEPNSAESWQIIRLLGFSPDADTFRDPSARAKTSHYLDPAFRFTTQDMYDAARLYRFVEENGFRLFLNIEKKPLEKQSIRQTPSVGVWPKIKHGFIMKTSDGAVEIGQFNTSRQNNLGQVVDEGTGFTYARALLANVRVPHIVIDAPHTGYSSSYKNLQKLQLEGDFNSSFSVYVEPKYAKDALYILTPDVMADLVDFFPGCDIEIVNGSLFICFRPPMDYTQPEVMKNLIEHVQVVTELLDKRLKNYDNPLIAAVTPEPLSDNYRSKKYSFFDGVGLNKPMKIFVVSSLVVMASFLIFTLVYKAINQ